MSRKRSIHGMARRRATILPLLVLSLVLMMGFLALAIDLGMVAVAKSQTQQAADLAALTSARSLNGIATGNYNQTSATTNAQNVLTYNLVLGQKLQATQLALTYGSYDYNQTSQTFNANFPSTAGMATSAVTATVTSSSSPNAFSKIWGLQILPNVTATAQAVHRPRDIALVMDLSGSMRFGTLLGYDFYTSSRTTNNPDSLVPTFGQYSSTSANLQGPSYNRVSGASNYTISPSNTTAASSSYSQTYVNGFYQNAAYATPLIRAFDSYSSTDGGTTWTAPTTARPQLPPASYASSPGGDAPLFNNSSTTTYATNVSDVVGGTATNALWELDGYSAYHAGALDTSGPGGFPKVWTQVDYSAPACQFNGYTQGPGYYGKTFFLWPPDPRNGAITSATLNGYLSLIGLTDPTDQGYLTSIWDTTNLTALQNWLKGATTKGGPYTAKSRYVPGSGNAAPIYYAVCRLFNRAYPSGSSNGAFIADWRVRFFGTNDNSVLFDVNGVLTIPDVTTYTIDYNAILTWIAQSAAPFPARMRAGRIKYYGAIPTQITGSWPSYGSTDQRFWAEFIDYVLGFSQIASGVYQDVSAMAGYGSEFSWGTQQTISPPAAPPYMDYSDNPARPQSRFWFGPMMMVDYMHNYNEDSNVYNYFYMQPGDSYEAPIYTAKEAFQAAVGTMKINHPNDWVTVVPYSWPRPSAYGGYGRFNCVSCPLGTNYDYAASSLLFPFSTINADGSANSTEITPYDADPATGLVPSANFTDTPRADGNTCFAMALMLCFNQFATTQTTDTTLRSYVNSSPITFPAGMAGGLGRKGAQKVVVFETDGLPNCYATANLANAGSYSYYQIRYNMNNPSVSEYPAVAATYINDSGVLTQIYSLVQQLATTYGTSRNPFRLYTIGFGPVFEGTLSSSAQSTLQNMQYYAGTQTSASTALPANQVITGTDAQMSAAMIRTYTSILQNGVQIALTK